MSQIAAKNDVPCVILRAMSDNADEDGHEVLVVKKFSISEYVATATKIVAAMVGKASNLTPKQQQPDRQCRSGLFVVYISFWSGLWYTGRGWR